MVGKSTRVFDRIQNLAVLNEQVSIPYRDRFQPGIYKNRIQFMFNGETETISFKCQDYALEAVRDRLPTAIVKQRTENGVIVEAKGMISEGLLMWLLSQGSRLEVLSPQKLRKAWLDEAKQLHFWDFYVNANAPEMKTWAQGMHRYFSDELALKILVKVCEIKESDDGRKQAKLFLKSYCKHNHLVLPQ